jgi:hypothetical protein
MAEQFLTYKGKPLVRKGNTVYYGDMSEKYIIRFTILSSSGEKSLDLSEKIKIELLLSDTSLKDKERIVKTSEKDGLYNAMDLGAIWLERALREK